MTPSSRIASPLVALFMAWPSVAMAAGPRVLEEGGRTIDPGGKTIVEFVLRGTKRPSVVIVTEQMQASGVSSGYFLELRGETIVPLCLAPCKVELDNGTYRMKVGPQPGGVDVRREFAVTAAGGTQTWEVTHGSNRAYGAGVVGLGVGLGLVVSALIPFGLSFAIEDEQERRMLRRVSGGLVVAGAPLGVLGTFGLVRGRPSVRLLGQSR